MRKLFILPFVLLPAKLVLAQLPKLDNPLDIAPSLSGNFGELRPNHFHGGLDLKTAGVENLEVHSVDTGYVSRIKVSPYGYGKALYIDHPNGYTTVYGHLNSYNKEITAYLKKAQYEQQSFSVDIYPGKGDLPISKGEIVALSGNTGGSGGPHLHFEIRETKSEVPRNPLLFNFPVSDSKKPVIEAVGIKPLNQNSTVSGSHRTQHFRTTQSSVSAAQPIKVNGVFGIEIMGYDQQDGSDNRNGIYRAELYVDGKIIGRFTADSIPFDQSRYLNALIDYGYYYDSKSRFMRLYRLPGNALENVRFENSGYLKLSPGIHQIEVKALDVSGNSTKHSFSVVVEDEHSDEAKPVEMLLWNANYMYESESVKIFVPKGAIYDSEPLSISEPDGTSNLSSIVEFMNTSIPLQFPISISLKVSEHKQGMIIARVSKSGQPINALETTHNGEWLEAESKQFGRFAVVIDNVAPKLVSLNLRSGQELNHGTLNFTVSDDLSGIQSFRVMANEQWVLAEYEPKKNLLFVSIDELPTSEEPQQLTVEVTDGAGNVSTFEASFFKR
ncbi:MAG: M23 family metallopeptidase [Flavobacteriales bacterium]